jgi:hypothetical protein
MIEPAEQLRGARTKLQRAEEHLGQLRTEHDSFITERNPYRMLREADLESGKYYVWRAKIVEQPPLEKWASIAGECVHALRSALDHTAFELVRIADPDATYSEFPIYKDKTGKNGWDDNGHRKLPGVSEEVLAVVNLLQPYKRRKEFDPLWRVHMLDIIDKHRHLNFVSPLLRQAHFAPIGGVVSTEVLAGPFKDGTPVARFTMTPDDEGTSMHVETRFAFDIAFGEGELLTNEPVMQTLEDLLIWTGGVVACFDRFFV